jgi:hypothetical protein
MGDTMTGTPILGKTHRVPSGADLVPLSPDGYTTTQEIANLANFVGVPIVSARDHGADPTGTVDSGPAINAAIAALPVTGGNVWIGPGNFKISTTIVVGDGSNGVASTRTGVTLIGGAAAVGPVFFGSALNVPSPTGPNGVCHLFSGAAVDMLHIRGPLQGWGVHNIDFDGASLGLIGISEIACAWGLSSGCLIRDFVTCQQMTSAVATLTGSVPNHMHNRYTNFAMRLPAINGSTGIWARGNGVNGNTNSCYDIWDDLTMCFLPATAGITLTGVHLQFTDTETFRNVHFIGTGGASGGGVINAVLYDYTAEAATMPTCCLFERVDFATSGTCIANVGIPSGSPGPNLVVFVGTANGTPSNPSLANLSWGVTAANP